MNNPISSPSPFHYSSKNPAGARASAHQPTILLKQQTTQSKLLHSSSNSFRSCYWRFILLCCACTMFGRLSSTTLSIHVHAFTSTTGVVPNRLARLQRRTGNHHFSTRTTTTTTSTRLFQQQQQQQQMQQKQASAKKKSKSTTRTIRKAPNASTGVTLQKSSNNEKIINLHTIPLPELEEVVVSLGREYSYLYNIHVCHHVIMMTTNILYVEWCSSLYMRVYTFTCLLNCNYFTTDTNFVVVVPSHSAFSQIQNTEPSKCTTGYEYRVLQMFRK